MSKVAAVESLPSSGAGGGGLVDVPAELLALQQVIARKTKTYIQDPLKRDQRTAVAESAKHQTPSEVCLPRLTALLAEIEPPRDDPEKSERPWRKDKRLLPSEEETMVHTVDTSSGALLPAPRRKRLAARDDCESLPGVSASCSNDFGAPTAPPWRAPLEDLTNQTRSDADVSTATLAVSNAWSSLQACNDVSDTLPARCCTNFVAAPTAVHDEGPTHALLPQLPCHAAWFTAHPTVHAFLQDATAQLPYLGVARAASVYAKKSAGAGAPCRKGRGKGPSRKGFHHGQEICKKYHRNGGRCTFGEGCKFYHASEEELSAALARVGCDRRYDLYDEVCLLLWERKHCEAERRSSALLEGNRNKS